MSWLTYLQIAESSAYCRPAYLRDPHDLVFWMADSSCHSMPQIQSLGISNRDWWGKLSHLASCKSFCLDTTSMWPNFYIFLQAGVMDFIFFSDGLLLGNLFTGVRASPGLGQKPSWNPPLRVEVQSRQAWSIVSTARRQRAGCAAGTVRKGPDKHETFR